MTQGQYLNTATACRVILWFCVCITGYYFFDRIIHQEIFGFHDWGIFYDHAKIFLLNGTLYDRDLSLYAPSSETYKFPPLYAAIMVLLLKHGYLENTLLHPHSIIYVSCYFLAIAICLRTTIRSLASCALPVSLIFVFTFEPFFDNYSSSQMEVYILLLLSLSILLLTRQRDFLAGFCTGIAAAIKIYPIYFAGYYFASKKYSALLGVFAGLVTATIFTLSIISFSEHEFYFMKVLPTLLAEDISGRGDNLSLPHLLINTGWSLTVAKYASMAIFVLPLIILARLSYAQANKKQGLDNVLWFCILTTSFLLATKNSWWNYQVLLILPILIVIGISIDTIKIKYISLIALIIASSLMFWCNLGKLDVLIIFFSKVLETREWLSVVMLKINLLRGLGTFIILLVLLYSLHNQHSKNISLVESNAST